VVDVFLSRFTALPFGGMTVPLPYNNWTVHSNWVFLLPLLVSYYRKQLLRTCGFSFILVTSTLMHYCYDKGECGSRPKDLLSSLDHGGSLWLVKSMVLLFAPYRDHAYEYTGQLLSLAMCIYAVSYAKNDTVAYGVSLFTEAVWLYMAWRHVYYTEDDSFRRHVKMVVKTTRDVLVVMFGLLCGVTSLSLYITGNDTDIHLDQRLLIHGFWHIFAALGSSCLLWVLGKPQFKSWLTAFNPFWLVSFICLCTPRRKYKRVRPTVLVPVTYKGAEQEEAESDNSDTSVYQLGV
jgi:predicted membrane channel-forming protein YqfA (hemolysin III family)